MYQTVGTNMADIIAKAMDKPILRKCIMGNPKI